MKKGAQQLRSALDGLDDRQRLRVLTELPDAHWSQDRAGWSVFRAPTTINPPTTLRLHYRDGAGRLCRVVSITEDGVTK